MDRYHLFPINNYRLGQSTESEKLFARVFYDKYFEKNVPDGCYFGCNLACAKSAEKNPTPTSCESLWLAIRKLRNCLDELENQYICI